MHRDLIALIERYATRREAIAYLRGTHGLFYGEALRLLDEEGLTFPKTLSKDAPRFDQGEITEWRKEELREIATK